MLLKRVFVQILAMFQSLEHRFKYFRYFPGHLMCNVSSILLGFLLDSISNYWLCKYFRCLSMIVLYFRVNTYF